MADSTTHHHYTRNVIWQFFIAALVIAAVGYWQRSFFNDIYIGQQITGVGIAINGFIVALFLLGLLRVLWMLLRYRREENAINRFMRNIRMGDEPLLSVWDNALMIHRYETVKKLNRKRAQINHSALAATLVATQASHNSFPRFVHNTLILTGVFGTIVSLSIALLGATDLIENINELNSLGTVIYSMSTALSTTMTAIMAYVFFGYFYIKLTDVQTYVVSRIEEVTATVLLPHLQISQDVMIKEFADSMHAATQLVQRFDETQASYQKSAEKLANILSRLEVNSQAQPEHNQALVEAIEALADRRSTDDNVQNQRVTEILALLKQRV